MTHQSQNKRLALNSLLGLLTFNLLGSYFLPVFPFLNVVATALVVGSSLLWLLSMVGGLNCAIGLILEYRLLFTVLLLRTNPDTRTSLAAPPHAAL